MSACLSLSAKIRLYRRECKTHQTCPSIQIGRFPSVSEEHAAGAECPILKWDRQHCPSQPRRMSSGVFFPHRNVPPRPRRETTGDRATVTGSSSRQALLRAPCWAVYSSQPHHLKSIEHRHVPRLFEKKR